MNSLDGVLSRIIFHKTSKWSRTGSKYLIGKLTSNIIVKGELDDPREGEQYRFYGEMKDQKGRDEQAFEFDSFEVLVDQSIAGQVQYLKTYVDGLGLVKSQALVDHFGPDTIAVLRERPERASEVSGITQKIVDSLTDHFTEVNARRRFDPVAFAKLIDMVSAFRVGKPTLKKLVEIYGSNAPAVVTRNPYLLLALPRMGWKTVDGFALSVAGYDPTGLERHAAAYLEAFALVSLDGHTHATLAELDRLAGGLLGMAPNRAAVTKIIGDGDVVPWKNEQDPRAGTFALAKLAAAETEIAEMLSTLTRAALPLPCDVGTDGLKPAQADAIRLLTENGVAILSGPPGTGKSYTIAKFLSDLVGNGVPPDSIRVVAPTGKASKRAAELIDKELCKQGIPAGSIPISTIHKALAPTPGSDDVGTSGPSVPSDVAKLGRGREGFTFGKNAADPIDARIIVIDESSMVDVKLGAALLRAIAPGTRVIFVGDPNQLPSVGPGAFLRDMMVAGIPTAELTEIVRSDGGGRVVRACHAIKNGEFPEPAPAVEFPTENWVHVELSDQNQIAHKIVELHESVLRNGNHDPVWYMQVVSPQNGRLPIACDNLNYLLSRSLNPRARVADVGDGRSVSAQEPDSGRFFVGDKVVRTSNGLVEELRPREASKGDADAARALRDRIAEIWNGGTGEHTTWNGCSYSVHQIPIVNGDMGEVLDIYDDAKGKPQVIVRFRTPDRLCRLPYASCDLIQAYALTCHKAQGSGFPYVIVPVHEKFWWDDRKGLGLFSREWLYTAISRAEIFLVTVGQFSAIRQAVGRQTLNVRKTKLADLIRRSFLAHVGTTTEV